MCRSGRRRSGRERRSITLARRRSVPETYTLSGHSVFYKNAKGEIFHTYGAFARGDEQFMGIYRFLDVLPKGREEYGPAHSLPDWAKVHDQYESSGHDQMVCGCASR